MDITSDRSKALTLSPFGRLTRPFTDVASNGEDQVIGKGKTLPDLARIFYNISKVTPISANYPFLDRDNKERSYDPGKEDPFVFSNYSSIQKFKDSTYHLIESLVKEWKAMGLPVKLDKDRKLELPDAEMCWENLTADNELGTIIRAQYSTISFILTNVDIMKKACIIRGIIPGWWASSYAGKDAPDADHFNASIRAHLRAIKILETTPRYKRLREELANEMGDPLDTNVGYPYYEAKIDAAGRPLTRYKVLHLFEKLGTNNYSVDNLFANVDQRCKGLGLDGFPFAIAPIRRSSYGWKWQHVFSQTSLGLVTDHDERGSNTTRIAWAVPYIFNLYMSPLQAELKTIRKMIPGLYHDGAAKVQRTKVLQTTNPYVSEADYSNYDRFMPVNLFMRFMAGYLADKPNGQYWLDMCHALHHRLPLIWPDYVGESKGRGWVFTPKKLGLLSGVKITSEEGSFINSIVNGQSYLDAGLGSEDDLVAYLTMYKDESVPIGSRPHYWDIQSDDTAHYSKDFTVLKKLGDSFLHNVKKAGLKGELMIGDRFLMRSVTLGRDTPVPSRVFQNTLQNEAPITDELTFLVGTAMRTDGMLGQKTFDPFGTKLIQPTLLVEVKYSLNVIEQLLTFLRTARVKQYEAINYLEHMQKAAKLMLASGSPTPTMPSEIAAEISKLRLKYLDMLATREQQLAMKGESEQTLRSMLYSLHKNSNIPSQKMLLDNILKANPQFGSILDTIAARENTFYKMAMGHIGIPTHL
jgi:hypothetical protein